MIAFKEQNVISYGKARAFECYKTNLNQIIKESSKVYSTKTLKLFFSTTFVRINVIY